MRSLSAIIFEIRARAFLTAHSTHTIQHAQGSLAGHLWGTYKLLRSWNAPEAVCRAGLFHSVYGTSVFRTATLSYADRPKVQRMIGKNAEELAYLFSSIYRPRDLIKAIDTGVVHQVGSGEAIRLTKEQISSLLLIESANLIDQKGGVALLRKIHEQLEAGYVEFPKKAQKALNTALLA